MNWGATMARNWVCAFCNRAQTITDGQHAIQSHYIAIGDNKHGIVGLLSDATACANPECREVTLTVHFAKGDARWHDFKARKSIQAYALRPQSSAKPQPDFIPKAIRDDYYEACLIRDLSPKASATLARRCLQGMIRDFCKISKSRLIDEIKELRKQLDDHSAAKGVTHESVDAIDAVRGVGNIGAHMEKDVDLIIDIEAGEAQLLIDLIEMLFEEWYVERTNRQRKLNEINALSTRKAQEIAALRASPTSEPLKLSNLGALMITDESGEP
jgi:hypothetical protein